MTNGGRALATGSDVSSRAISLETTKAARRSGRLALNEASAANLLFVGTVVGAFGLLLILAEGMTFATFGDEWTFVVDRALTDPGTWLAPHNEHWSTAFVIVFRGVLETFGLTSYLPYIVVLASLHVTLATAIYVLARGQVRPFLAMGLVLPFVFFGFGWENLLLFFQGSIVMALAAGAWAMVLLRVERLRLLAAVLLAVSVMSASAGVFMAAAAGIEVLLRRDWRGVLAVVPAAVLYAIWYLLIGPDPIASTVGVRGISDLLFMAVFIPAQLAAAVGGLFGLGFPFGILPTLGITVGIIVLMRRRPETIRRPEVLGPAVALLGSFGAVALSRHQFGLEAATYSRYIHTSAVLLIPLGAALLSGVSLPQDRQIRRLVLVGGVLVLDLALVLNLAALWRGGEGSQERSDIARAVITTSLGPAGQTVPDRVAFGIPPAPCLAVIVERFGSPLASGPAPSRQALTMAEVAFRGEPVPIRVYDLACDPQTAPGLR